MRLPARRQNSPACHVAVFAAAALSVLLAACGGGGSNDGPPDVKSIATATLPAELPEPMIIGGGAVLPGGGSSYTIQSGDTLSAVAARFGTTIEALLSANPGISATNLHAGDQIRLPENANSSPAPPAETAAPEPTEEPAATNTPEPAPTNTPSSLGSSYIVQSGDIPETIAAKFGITVEALLAANPGINPNNLQVGQALVIPPAATAEPTPGG